MKKRSRSSDAYSPPSICGLNIVIHDCMLISYKKKLDIVNAVITTNTISMALFSETSAAGKTNITKVFKNIQKYIW